MGLFRKSGHAHLMVSAAVGALAMGSSAAWAQSKPINIAPQTLISALHEFGAQTGRQVFYTPELTESKTSAGVVGATDERAALAEILQGTGLTFRREANAFIIEQQGEGGSGPQGAGAGGDVDALIVTAQKREENIQDVPIAISAFSQEDLTRSQVAGGPDLMTQVPNFTFTKTNFSSYSIQIRGIGTQAISATTDAAVAVAFNNTPFIRNRFFEQEFYDLQRVEVLRGPQGTLYGRNATAGVVNIISAKPKFAYEAALSGDIANYSSRRLEGMVNVPLVEDVIALRIAGAWTKREGFVTNEITNNPIDGRDLWSTRVSLRFAPTDNIEANLIWEHFNEDDDRLRSGKQLCNKDIVTEVDGIAVPYAGGQVNALQANLSQGCAPASLYSPDSFQTPNGYSLPYYHPLAAIGLPVIPGLDPYLSTTQSRDLRVIESTVDPHYRAETDVLELQFSIDLSDNLTLSSETGYLSDTLFSTQDFNRFNTARGAFNPRATGLTPGLLDANGTFCDPQIGCADRLVAIDLSTADSSHFSQEFRLGSNFDGPFNFSLGANFLRYDSVDKYYVFVNTLTMYAARRPDLPAYVGGVSDNSQCLQRGFVEPVFNVAYNVNNACTYIDPNPLESLNDLGHNYFLSKNPYKLISYAVFGEVYYNITENLKLTGGLRWTVDKKEAPRIPSWILASGQYESTASGAGYSTYEVLEQEWQEPTGRLAIDWKPDLGFTDETLLYASYARGYKAGGANPPPAGLILYEASGKATFINNFVEGSAAHPKTFEAEFVNAFELGAKNTLASGTVTLNLAAFYYDYTGYQISQIVDRSATNLNFDAKVWGLEIEADWRPLENLRLGFKGGYEKTRVADGARAIDLMDRTAGNPDWVLVRPFPSLPSNCILPLSVINQGGVLDIPGQVEGGNISGCELAYVMGVDPITGLAYVPNPTEHDFGSAIYPGYEGWDPTTAPNHGAGFFKDLSGNELPNAPHFTATITADYTTPLMGDWLATLHTDLYYQSEAWTRIFNTEGYDKLKAYTNINLAAIITSEERGWRIMAYIKNVMDRDSITGAFLNSDDTGLTTNVFLTEPRLYGVRVTKEFTGGPWWTGANSGHTGPYPLTVELGGQVQRHHAPYETLAPDFIGAFSGAIDPTAPQNRDLDWGDGREVRLVYRPEGSPWRFSLGGRIGRTNSDTARLHQEDPAGPTVCQFPIATPQGQMRCNPSYVVPGFEPGYFYNDFGVLDPVNWSDSTARQHEEHTVIDFQVGRDLGVGILGSTRSRLAAGLRHAELESITQASMDGIPNWVIPDAWFFNTSTNDRYRAAFEATREFSGRGPTLSWEATAPLWGGEETGALGVDWTVTGGLLYGKQKTSIQGGEEHAPFSGRYYDPTQPARIPVWQSTGVVDLSRETSVNVPLLDVSLGLSYEVQRVRVGLGYRWERYFDAIDAGFQEEEASDRTIDGPYFKLSVGFGG